MKLGMIIQPKPEEFDHLKALGLDFAELDCNPVQYFGKTNEELQALLPELKAASERTGIEVGAVGRWASPILNADGSINAEEWANVQGVIDFGKALGAKYYLCSVAYVPQLTYYGNITAAIAVLRKIVAAAKEAGMETAIVNCMMGDNYIRTPEQWKLVLDEVPGLGIKYDPSHSFVHGGENGAYLQEAFDWGDRFKYVHIKGVVQRGDSIEPEMWKKRQLMEAHPELKEILGGGMPGGNKVYDNPPAGIDSINWRAFFGILYKYGYDGYLSIEPHSATWRDEKGEWGVKYTIKYIRDLMYTAD
jgi:sugar phosphate isomerase/epimerase